MAHWPPPALLGGVLGLGGHSHPAATGSGTVSLELWEMEVSFLFCGKRSESFCTFIGLIRIKRDDCGFSSLRRVCLCRPHFLRDVSEEGGRPPGH